MEADFGTENGNTLTRLDPIGIPRAASFHLVIPSFPLLWGDKHIVQETTYALGAKTISHIGRFFEGIWGPFEFALSQLGSDLQVDVRTLPNVKLERDEDDHQFLDALLEALAFTHGLQPIPIQKQHRRNHRLVSDRVFPVRLGVDASSRAPFPQRLIWESAMGNLKFDFGSSFNLILRFFAEKRDLSDQLTFYLAELRSISAAGIDPSHAALAVCRVFEGVVNVLFKHEELQESLLARPGFLQFEKAKAEVIAWIEQQDFPEMERLIGALRGASGFSPRSKYDALVVRYALPSTNTTAKIISDWNKWRNPLAHGKISAETDTELLEQWMASLRIAGGINMLVLKAMGYSGWMQISSLEGHLIEI